MEKFDSHCTNFHEILYHGRVLKSVHQIQVLLNKPTGADTLMETEGHLFSYLAIYETPYKKYGTTRQAEDTTDDLHIIRLLRKSKGEKG
jgi:hypothetical protein